MALKHAHPLDVIDLAHPLDPAAQSASASLLRTPALQLVRLVLAAGHRMPQHQVPGALTLHCLAGEVVVEIPGHDCRLQAGQLVALDGGHPHGLHAPTSGAVVLLTLLHPAAPA